MRLYLLPISTRQALLYCQQLGQRAPAPQHQVWADWATDKVTKTWVDWEAKKSGWKRMVTSYGNAALKRLPHEEYSLKGIPALERATSGSDSNPPQYQMQRVTTDGQRHVEIAYPSKFVRPEQARHVLQRLSNKHKQAYHYKWLMASLLGMPLSAPVALVPM